MLGWKVMGAGVPSLEVIALTQDTATSVSAAGTTQGTATELSSADNEVATVAAGAGVVLSSKLAPGDTQTVFNAGANPLKVYPPSGAAINAASANAAYSHTAQTAHQFKCFSATQWFAL